MRKLLTDFSLTPEFLVSMAGIIFLAGGFFMMTNAYQKRTDKRIDNIDEKMKETEKSLQNVINLQGIYNEKILNVDGKVSKLETQSTEILKILNRKHRLD